LEEKKEQKITAVDTAVDVGVKITAVDVGEKKITAVDIAIDVGGKITAVDVGENKIKK
jgi:hypothetical protein